MRVFKIGFWIDNYTDPKDGGGFGYVNQLLYQIDNHQFDNRLEFIFLSKNKIEKHFSKNKYTIQTKAPVYKSNNLFWRIIFLVQHIFKIKILESNESKEKKYHESIQNELKEIIDIIYYPSPVIEITNFPFIYTLWDLGHLSTYSFPEISMNGIFEKRVDYHKILPFKALGVFCESECGKQQAIKYLNLDEKRLHVIPIFPSQIIQNNFQANQPKNIDKDEFFVHYPAQYWAHKNHFNLLVAFKEVVTKIPTLKLVLTGSDKGNKEYISGLITELNLSENVIELGFIENEQLKWLYLNSQGLVMPTFLGPTNMPLLEAAELGCKVACSDLGGHREQLKDYAYYFNPLNPEDISEKIIEMVSSDEKKELETIFKIENSIASIEKAFVNIRNVRFCWGSENKIQ